MLTSKITKTWSEGSSKWMYQRHVAYLDDDNNLQTTLVLGWSLDEVIDKTEIMKAALIEAMKEEFPSKLEAENE